MKKNFVFIFSLFLILILAFHFIKTPKDQNTLQNPQNTKILNSDRKKSQDIFSSDIHVPPSSPTQEKILNIKTQAKPPQISKDLFAKVLNNFSHIKKEEVQITITQENEEDENSRKKEEDFFKVNISIKRVNYPKESFSAIVNKKTGIIVRTFNFTKQENLSTESSQNKMQSTGTLLSWPTIVENPEKH